MTKGVYENVVGVNFNRLTVLEEVRSTSSNSYRNRLMLRVKCVCGKEKLIRKTELRRRISCGCQRIEDMKLEPGKAALGCYYRQYRRNAKSRKYQFLLTLEEFALLAESECFYCGCAPSTQIPQGHRYNGSPLVNGIDRVDNTKGYISGNCVTCCRHCNLVKGSISPDMIYKIARFLEPK